MRRRQHLRTLAVLALVLAGCDSGGEADASETSSGGTDSGTEEESGESTETGPEDTGETGSGDTGETGSDDTGETSSDDTGDTGPDDTGENLRPDDAPDWLVITVSGHCIPPGCAIPGTNHEYLGAQGTGDRFTDALEAWGKGVELWSYSDELYNRDVQTHELLPGVGDPVFYGFLQLHEDLQFVRDEWVADFDNPTKVLVVAHSHGVVWAHTALHVVDDLPIEVMIDLDGKSLGWESESILLGFGDDWGAEISNYTNQHDISWPFDIRNAEGGWNIPGQGSMDVEDVIPDSVRYNLEIQAIPGVLMPLPDTDDNRRLDGGQIGITIFRSNSEDHMEVEDPNAQAINWALAQFAQLVVP